MTEISKRDQLIALMSDVQSEQVVAMEDLGTYLRSAEGTAFQNKIQEVRGKTLPGSSEDNILGSFLGSLNQLAMVGVAPMPMPPVPMPPNEGTN